MSSWQWFQVCLFGVTSKDQRQVVCRIIFGRYVVFWQVSRYRIHVGGLSVVAAPNDKFNFIPKVMLK